MTAITIDRSLLEQALDVLITRGAQPGYETERAWLKIVKSLEATLAAPATAPEFPADWAQMIHYPECWDTAAYPELRYAIHEALAWSGCSVCKSATAPERKPKPFIGTLKAIYKCTDCGHEQSVTEVHTEHGVYVGSGANWCDKCELGKPERKETP